MACQLFGRLSHGAESDWAVRTWQIPDGSNNFVTSIVQSSDGYLWMSTSAGLTQFDGEHFHYQRIGAIVGLPDSRVRAMLRTHDGAVWAAFDGAIVVLRINQQPRVIRENVPVSHAISMEEDGEGSVWISYFAGPLCKVSNDRVTIAGTESRVAAASLAYLATDTKGTLWISKDAHVGFMRNGTYSETLHLSGITSIGAARDGGLWIIAGFQLYKYSIEGELVPVAGLPYKRAQAEAIQLLEDDQGSLWIGSATAGLFRMDAHHNIEAVATPQAHITSLYEDHEGNLWAGTDAGLDRISRRVVQLVGTESGLPLGGVLSVCQAPDGPKWAAATDGVLMTQVNGLWQRAPFWGHEFATCVTCDAAGALWIGTKGRHLYRWNAGKLRMWGVDEGLQPHTVTALFAGANGDLWIGSASPTNIQYLRNDRIFNIDIPAGNGQVCAILEDRKGNIWFGRTGKGGLFRVTDDKVFSVALPNPYNPVHALYLSDDGAVWAACYATGMARVKDGRLTIITAAQGLYDDHISQMVADHRGWLWLGSDHGVFRLGEKQLNDVADGRNSRVESVHYGGDEGLPLLQARYGYSPNSMLGADGLLEMAMASNLVSISPMNVPEQVPPPPLQIEQVILDDQVIAAYGSLLPASPLDLAKHGEFRIPSNYTRLQIDFTALSFLAPSNVHFEYELRGIEDRWTDGDSDRRAVYPRLPPGEYHFVVRASNSNGIWNEAGTSIAFTITPALWQRWWFVPAAVLLFGIFIATLARYVSLRRIRTRLRLLEHQTAVARERSRIARDLHDDLGARLTNIIMLTERSLRESNHVNSSGDLVRHVATGVRQAIKSLDETVWAVNPRNDTLPHMINYIGQSSVEYLRTANIRCRVRLLENSPEREVSAEIRHNVLLVVKEALNNIVRHAQATEVVIGVSIEQKMIRLTIEDNGRGFSTVSDDAFADGLRNMRERMNDIDGKCEISSETGAGTRIYLYFPWSRRT